MPAPTKPAASAASLKVVRLNRRGAVIRILGGASTLLLAGCEAISRSKWFPKLLGSVVTANQHTQQLLASNGTLAQEFSEADLSPTFRSNGTANPQEETYQQHVMTDFR